MSKKLSLLILVVLLCFTVVLSACGNLNDLLDLVDDDFVATTDTFKTAEEVKSSLTNYWFEYNLTSSDGTVEFVDIQNSKAWYYEMSGTESAYLQKKEDLKSYVLDLTDMSYYVYDITEEDISFEGWGLHMFGWFENVSGLENDGTAEVLGKTCNKYKYTFMGFTTTYYIDREYDICLKWEYTLDNQTVIFEVTKYQIGGVVDNFADTILADYTQANPEA